MKKHLSVGDWNQKLSSEAGRPIELCGIVKAQSPSAVKKRLLEGLRIVGVNYVQEGLLLKQQLEADEQLAASNSDKASVRWDFVGKIQSNKIKLLVRHFGLIHSVSQEKHLAMIDKEARATNKVQSILVEVNSGEEERKSGLPPKNVLAFVEALASYPNVFCLGMMTMGPQRDEAEDMRPYFESTHRLYMEAAECNRANYSPKTLSMGMSSDFQVALRCGSTLVRLGSALFGARSPQQ